MNNLSNEDLRIFAGVLVQAAAGAEIQGKIRCRSNVDWIPKEDFDNWYPAKYEYRMKPKPREIWVNVAAPHYEVYSNTEDAFEHMDSDIKYDGIAVHFKEVIEDDD